MRIGVSVSSLGMGGGTERYALDVINGLLDCGHEVVAFCRKADRAAAGMERVRDIRLIPCRFIPNKLRDSWFSRRLDRLRRDAGLDAHISCSMAAHPDISPCGGTHRGFLAAMGKRPYFFDRRQIAFETTRYTNARVIIAHSKMMREELITLYGIAPGKIRLLYPPVNAARFTPPAAEERERLRAQFGFAPDRKYFLFPSTGHVRKGLPFLRKFFETTELPVELVVAGRPAEPGRNIRSIGYSGRMELLYRAADATVLASLYEPFGLVGVESVLSGTPVVLPADMGCCEVLGEPFLAAFKPGDAEDFARAVRATAALDRARLPEPARAIGYDCGCGHHVKNLLACL